MTGLDRELLIEIGCEEIPASWLPGLTAQLGRHLDARLKEFRLTGEGAAETYSTPRRLTARVAKLSERQADFEELVTGPPVSAAFKPDGQPTPAASSVNSGASCVQATVQVEPPSAEVKPSTSLRHSSV